MSSLTRCNFCTLEDMVKLADSRQHFVTLTPAPLPEFPDGRDVYIHPLDYTPPSGRTLMEPDEAANGPADSEWWAAWFAAIPSRCACHE